MWLAFWLVISIGPYLYTAWRISGEIAWKDLPTEREIHRYSYRTRTVTTPEGSDWVEGIAAGVFGGLAWPILLPLLIYKTFNSNNSMGYIPRNHKIRMQEEKIKELEREVGIR